eukprot:10473257-Karenia_brevis.AAC.1
MHGQLWQSHQKVLVMHGQLWQSHHSVLVMHGQLLQLPVPCLPALDTSANIAIASENTGDAWPTEISAQKLAR